MAQSRRQSARETRAERARFAASRRAERQYMAQLRQIAQQIGVIVRGIFNPDDPADPGWEHIRAALDDYGTLIGPWAEAVARRMLGDVSRRDETQWYRLGKMINTALAAEVRNAPTGQVLRDLMASQVDLITSLPRRAAERIHELSIEALVGGRRWEDLTAEVLASGDVSLGHAKTIARTETGRAQSNFTAARAVHIGSPGFIWRTARDADVRLLHRQFEGQFYPWQNPPILDDGRPGLPGTIWNCRCFSEVVLPDQEPALGPRARNQLYEAALLPEADPLNERYRQGAVSRAEYEAELAQLAATHL